MRKLGLPIFLTLLIVAAAYYGLVIYPERQFRAAIDSALQNLPPGYSVTYDKADYAVLPQQATIRNLILHVPAPANSAIAVDEIDIDKPALDFAQQWASARQNAGTLPLDFALPVFRGATFNGLTARGDWGSAHMDSYHIDGLRLYPAALLRFDLASFSSSLKQLEQRQQQEQEQASPQQDLDALLPIIRSEAAAILGVAYDGSRFSNVSWTVQIPATAELPAHSASYSIGEWTEERSDRGQYARGVAKSIKAEDPALGNLTLEELAYSDLDARQALTQLLNGQDASFDLLNGIKLGRIAYNGLSLATKDGAALQLGSYSLADLAFANGKPVSLQFAMTGLALTRSLMKEPQAAEAFDMLGLDTMTIGFGFTYHWDQEQKLISIRDASLKIDELGSLTATADFSDASPAAPTAQVARLSHALFRYDDASLTDRMVQGSAKKNGTDPAAYRQQVVFAIHQQAAQLGDDPKIAAAADAITNFISTPKNLTVEMTPPDPVPVGVLPTLKGLAPAEIIAMLGIAVTANQ